MDSFRTEMRERFVSEPIIPDVGAIDTSRMTPGEPGLPQSFVWRDRQYAIESVYEKWKETSPCRGGSSERYVRKHWYKILTRDGSTMKIYFERHAKSGSQPKRRWWLYTISKADALRCESLPRKQIGTEDRQT